MRTLIDCDLEQPGNDDAMEAAELAVDFSAVADAKNQDEQLFVFDLADEPVITNTIFPELPEF